MRSQTVMAVSLVLALGFGGVATAEQATLSPEVLSVLKGEGWAGTLTYRDYSPPFDEEVIPVKMSEVEIVDDGVLFGMIYPGEEDANSHEALFISEDGTELGGSPVMSTMEMGDSLVVMTKKTCDDDGRPAVCERIFRIAPNAFSMAKEVTLDETGERFVRNRYDFTR